MSRIRNVNEVAVGVFLILVAMLAFYLTWNLRSITDVGLGPGYVPKMFAVFQIVIGSVLIFHGFIGEGEASEPWEFRSLLFVLAAVAFFAASIERLGLVVSLVGLVLIGCAADRETKLHEALILAAGVAIGSSLLFVKALGLSIGLWPRLF